MKKKYFLIILLFSVITGCATIKRVEYIPDNNENPKKVVIVYHDSKFRRGIMDNLISKLNEANIFMIVDDAVNINKYNPKDYDLVVAFMGIHAFIQDAYPFNYLYKYRKEKNVMKVYLTFLTKEGVTVIYNKEGKIDSITAASIDENSEDLIDSIYNLILKKVGLSNE